MYHQLSPPWDHTNVCKSLRRIVTTLNTHHGGRRVVEIQRHVDGSFEFLPNGLKRLSRFVSTFHVVCGCDVVQDTVSGMCGQVLTV